jgi:hypothetical protein
MPIEQDGCAEGGGLASAAAVVLDPRLAEVWQLVWGLTDGADAVPKTGSEPGPAGVRVEVVGALLRLAYLQGYADAYAEEVPGELFAELGVRAGPVNLQKG